MKIAIFTETFLPGIGGTENAVLQYATELSKTDEVLLVAPDYHKPCDDGAFPFKVLRTKSIPVTKNDMWAMPALTPKIKKAIEDFAPDVLNCQHWGMTSGLANKYAKKHGVPLIYVVHTKFLDCYKQAAPFPLPHLFIKNGIRRLNKADVACAVSYSMAHELSVYGYKKPVTVIRNGFDFKPEAVIKKQKQASDPFVFLFVGRIVSYKNIAFSLRALAIVKNTRSDFTFYIVGTGPHVKKFQRLAKKLGLTNNVVFTGATMDKKVLYKYYADADLLLFPSIFDNDPLAIIEAASAGTPSLVLHNTGASERITDGVNGFIVNNSVSVYAEKILSIMQNRQVLNMPSVKNIYIHNSWQDTVNEYKKIYSELIEKRKNATASRR